MNAKLHYDLESKKGTILFYNLDSKQFDNLRILLKTIMDYGQFPGAKQLSEDLAMKKLIKQIAIEEVKKDSQKILLPPNENAPTLSPNVDGNNQE